MSIGRQMDEDNVTMELYTATKNKGKEQVGAHAFNASSREAEAGDLCE